MRRVLTCLPQDRRQAQAGTTLVELLVSLAIVGLVLVVIVGTFSTGLLTATIAKRNTAVEAAVQYEMDRISSSPFGISSYSECFAPEAATPTTSTPPDPLPNYQDPCRSSKFTLRADVKRQTSNSPQVWIVTVSTWPSLNPIGNPITVYKVNG